MSGAVERFLLAPFGDRALVLDLETGTLCRVSGAAVAICQGLARGTSTEAVAARLAREAGIPLVRARSDVESVRAQIAAAPAVAAGSGPVTFEPTRDGFEMRCGGRPVLLLDPAGREAAMPGDPAARPDPEWRLRLALPHLLMLRGQPVLHASAVRRGDGVVAISGATGSGKSTLAALLADGAPISDDLTLLRLGETRPAAILGGEAAARRWTAREAQRLAGGAKVVLSDADLHDMASCPALDLLELWFLDAGGRGGEEMALERAALEDGLLLLLLNGFGELAERAVWRRLFEVSRLLAERVPVSRVRVPETLPALRAAARRYSEKVAS